MAKATVSLAGRDILDLESFSVEEISTWFCRPLRK